MDEDEEVPPHMKTRTIPDDFGVLCIAIRKPLATYLWSLQHTGLYGIDIAETVDRALCDTVNREVLRGFIPRAAFQQGRPCDKHRPASRIAHA